MRLVSARDPDFAEAAYGRIFNARKPAAQPAAVAQPETPGDVAEAVRLARREGWTASVRSGGHSWAGWSVREGALLIDLGFLRELTLDGEIATASPAVKGGEELTPFLAERGRMFTGGHCGGVGLGGFLLQGGQGWNSRRWGWGCENVVGIDVVTADGELLQASEDAHADLFWAARGAGPRFPGVITRFHLRTYPAVPMFHDTRTYRHDDLEPLLHWLHDLIPRLDVAVEPVVAASRRALLLHTTLTADDEAVAARLLAPFDAGPVTPLTVERGPTTIMQENLAQAAQNPAGYRYAADSQWTNADAAALYPLLRELYGTLPTDESFSIWYGWAPTRELPDMAFSLEHDVYLATYAIWPDDADDARLRAWVHEQHARLAGTVGEGLYVGDSDFTARPDRYLSDVHAARLEAVCGARDPDGVFA